MMASRYQTIAAQLGIENKLADFEKKLTSVNDEGDLITPTNAWIIKNPDNYPALFAREELKKALATLYTMKRGKCFPANSDWSCFIVSSLCLCLPLCVAYCYDSSCVPTESDIDVVKDLLDRLTKFTLEELISSHEMQSVAFQREAKNVINEINAVLWVKIPEDTRGSLMSIRLQIAKAHQIPLADIKPFSKSQQRYSRSMGSVQKLEDTHHQQYQAVRQ